VSGACFAQFGHDVVCIDKDAGKIDRLRKGEMPIYEPGLDRLVADNIKSRPARLHTDLNEAVATPDAAFIAVGTPTGAAMAHADLTYVYAAAAELAQAIRGYTVIVHQVDGAGRTGARWRASSARPSPAAEFDVCSNPEFPARRGGDRGLHEARPGGDRRREPART
jgi:UDPglucose 6-dehydrogenase